MLISFEVYKLLTKSTCSFSPENLTLLYKIMWAYQGKESAESTLEQAEAFNNAFNLSKIWS